MDPGFALAYAAAADTSIQLLNYNSRRYTTLVQLAKEYATKAVAMNPRLAEAHATLAAVRQMEWDWTGAEASYQEALRINPGFGPHSPAVRGVSCAVGKVERGFSRDADGAGARSPRPISGRTDWAVSPC